jgi:putative oxidoreductase
MLKKVQSLLFKGSWFPVLLARVSVGWVFIESGWGKLHNLPKVIEFFQSLGIPAPELQARVVALVELGGGFCLFVGLCARLVSLPLTATMVVAIVTAKRADINSISDLFGMEEYLFILVFLWVLFCGPGRVALDTLIVRRSHKS